jgi:peptidoglycan hydrolase-like protein with peptidoglycan-binding domain
MLGLNGEDVRALQEYLIYIRKAYPEIPELTADGDFGPETERAVIAFNNMFGITGNPARINAQSWNTLTSIYEDLYFGSTVRTDQFPGYNIGE